MQTWTQQPFGVRANMRRRNAVGRRECVHTGVAPWGFILYVVITQPFWFFILVLFFFFFFFSLFLALRVWSRTCIYCLCLYPARLSLSTLLDFGRLHYKSTCSAPSLILTQCILQYASLLLIQCILQYTTFTPWLGSTLLVIRYSVDACKHCEHIVAKHTHTFEVRGAWQESTMVCMLCGRAADTQSVMPQDPRRMHVLF